MKSKINIKTAIKNIRNRVCEVMLWKSLLKQLDNGVFEHGKLKLEKAKEVLLSFRRNLLNVDSECMEDSLVVFGYVQFFGCNCNKNKLSVTGKRVVKKPPTSSTRRITRRVAQRTKR